MLSLNLLKIVRNCDKVISRNIRGKGGRSVNANPGLSNRIKAFREEGVQITESNADEFIEDSETDLRNVGETYNEHLNETLVGKHELRHMIVKEKYFKENMPNLLTWSEKEQIRHLCMTQPDEWTPEKIAESFPVTVPVVKKLLRYPWKPASEQRIARHDASAMRNWRELKEGTFSIPEELRNHFLKFSDRKIPPLSKKSLKIDITQENKIREFEQIVRKCANMEKPADSENNNERNSNQKLKLSEDNKFSTLEQLADKIKARLDKGKEIVEPDKLILDSVKAIDNQINNDTIKDLSTPSKLSNENKIIKVKEEEKDINVFDYPERIRIPKKAYKKGATYKINDVFYDHDGKFLYRVLGMTNN